MRNCPITASLEKQGGEWGYGFELALHKLPFPYCPRRLAYVDSCKFVRAKLLPYRHLASIWQHSHLRLKGSSSDTSYCFPLFSLCIHKFEIWKSFFIPPSLLPYTSSRLSCMLLFLFPLSLRLQSIPSHLDYCKNVLTSLSKPSLSLFSNPPYTLLQDKLSWCTALIMAFPCSENFRVKGQTPKPPKHNLIPVHLSNLIPYLLGVKRPVFEPWICHLLDM